MKTIRCGALACIDNCFAFFVFFGHIKFFSPHIYKYANGFCINAAPRPCYDSDILLLSSIYQAQSQIFLVHLHTKVCTQQSIDEISF